MESFIVYAGNPVHESVVVSETESDVLHIAQDAEAEHEVESAVIRLGIVLEEFVAVYGSLGKRPGIQF